MESEDLVELLPGMPDDITLELIVPKLSGGDVFILSTVSRSWRQAIQTRMVHDARVSSQSLETLAIVKHLIPNSPFLLEDVSYWISKLSLYSMRNKSWYDFPGLPGGIPHGCQCIALDGKFYVMGGGHFAITLDGLFYSMGGGCLEDEMRTKEVYVLDLAGKRQWRQCASMHAPRANFGAGVFNGKIYAFAGCPHGSEPEYLSEVYDPKDDVWSPIQPLYANRVFHQVAVVGNELFLYGEFDRCAFEHYDGEELYGDESDDEYDYDRPMLLEAFDPMTNETREIDPTLLTLGDKVFISKGIFHRVTDHSIDVYHFKGNNWVPLRSFSKFPHETITSASPGPGCIVAFEDGNLLVHCVDSNNITNGGPGLLLSTASGGKSEKISWEIVEWPLQCAGYSYIPEMYPIQL